MIFPSIEFILSFAANRRSFISVNLSLVLSVFMLIPSSIDIFIFFLYSNAYPSI